MCRVGLTYDLKSDYLTLGYTPHDVMEFDDEGTVTGLEAALAANGCTPERVGRAQELARRLAAGERWDLVFNIAEGLGGRCREAQVPSLCELYQQPYTFSDPLTCSVTLDKAVAKRLVRDAGIPTPAFAVVETPADAEAVDLPFPVFVKPLAEGSSKGVTGRSLVEEPSELPARCRELLESAGQPLLVETFLPGREVTVGVIGNGAVARVVGVMEVHFTTHSQDAAYTALNKDKYLDCIRYELLNGDRFGQDAARLGLAAYRVLGCRDAGRIDLRADADGRLSFLEANPLPGLHEVRSDLPILARLAGIPYRRLMGDILTAALARYAP